MEKHSIKNTQQLAHLKEKISIINDILENDNATASELNNIVETHFRSLLLLGRMIVVQNMNYENELQENSWIFGNDGLVFNSEEGVTYELRNHQKK